MEEDFVMAVSYSDVAVEILETIFAYLISDAPVHLVRASRICQKWYNSTQKCFLALITKFVSVPESLHTTFGYPRIWSRLFGILYLPIHQVISGNIMIREIYTQKSRTSVAPFYAEHKSLTSKLSNLLFKPRELTDTERIMEQWANVFKEPQIDAIVMVHHDQPSKMALTEASPPEPWYIQEFDITRKEFLSTQKKPIMLPAFRSEQKVTYFPSSERLLVCSMLFKKIRGKTSMSEIGPIVHGCCDLNWKAKQRYIAYSSLLYSADELYVVDSISGAEVASCKKLDQNEIIVCLYWPYAVMYTPSTQNSTLKYDFTVKNMVTHEVTGKFPAHTFYNFGIGDNLMANQHDAIIEIRKLPSCELVQQIELPANTPVQAIGVNAVFTCVGFRSMVLIYSTGSGQLLNSIQISTSPSKICVTYHHIVIEAQGEIFACYLGQQATVPLLLLPPGSHETQEIHARLDEIRDKLAEIWRCEADSIKCSKVKDSNLQRIYCFSSSNSGSQQWTKLLYQIPPSFGHFTFPAWRFGKADQVERLAELERAESAKNSYGYVDDNFSIVGPLALLTEERSHENSPWKFTSTPNQFVTIL